MSYMASNEKEKISFKELQNALEFSSGNLSTQLKKLKEAGYLSIGKKFNDNKPLTTVTITPKGFTALSQYVEEMEKIITSLKKEI